MTTIFINELHYENIGKDVREGVEIAAPAGTDLSGWVLYQYGGKHGKVEGNLKLSGVSPNLQNGWGVRFFPCELRNDSHGVGLALVDPTGKVVQFLSYTAVVDAKEGPAQGLTSQLIPVAENFWTAVGSSLQLQGKGNKYEDFTWAGPEPATYGKVASRQTFEPLKPGVGGVQDIDLQVSVNRANHHTDKYHAKDLSIIRRGANFLVALKITPDIKASSVVARFKVYPEGKTFDAKVFEDEGGATDPFAGFVSSSSAGQVVVAFKIPANAIVGDYLFSVSLSGGKTFSAESHVIILFNPWSEQDGVYLEKDDLRNEYILSDDGLIWTGNQHSNAPRAWNFAQFNTKSLFASLKLIQKIPVENRGDPVVVSRHLSSLVNLGGEGVLVGNWSNDFSGGTAPTEWTGSGPILKEFLLSGKPVRYAQCWVFSGVLTSVLRSIGIPARSTTNFASAHEVPDPGYHRSVDKYFKVGGTEIDEEKSRDSIWNFHVWNDVWMTRPDLGPLYFGWQALDSTPQELSDGLYQMGPAPLVAIKEGTKDVNYDLEFVYAEVNADENYFLEQADGTYKLVRTITDSVGKSMSTKAVGTRDRHDVTLGYKYPEGSIQERASHGATDQTSGDVKLRWEVQDTALIGSLVPAKVILETTADVRTVQLQLTISQIQYTGQLRKNLQKGAVNLLVHAGKATQAEFDLKPENYVKDLKGASSFVFKAYAEVKETGQTSILLREFDFKNFELQLIPPAGKITIGSNSTTTVIFTNKLPIALTNLVLTIDGQGISKLQKYKFASLAPGETLKQVVPLSILETGKHLLIAKLDSDEISDIHGHEEINVE